MSTAQDPALTDAERATADALRRQHAVLMQEAPVRFVATAAAFAIAAIYLPPPLILALALIDLAGEIVSWAILSGDPPALARDPRRRAVLVACIVVIETSFAMPAALMWHIEDPFTKALAVGLMAGSMMHLATARSIYLPTGVGGWTTLLVLTVVSNTAYWVQRGDLAGLTVTSICVVVGYGYFGAAMWSNHRLHRETAAAARAAEAADAAKGRFLAQMSHELRTPLNAILGLGHAEMSRAGDATARDRMQVIVSAAGTLATLLDDVLDLSALEAGRLPLRPKVAHPDAAVEAALALWRPAVEAAGLAFRAEIDPRLSAPALFDPQRLRQCLSNLLSNALRHTARGSVTVTARQTACPVHGGRWIELRVTDTGSGIAPDLRARLFRPVETAAGAGGHGIGLTIAREMARAMGGDLTLQDPAPEASGETFVLVLPLHPVPASAGAEDPQPPSAAPMLAGRSILVVDDIATNRLVAAACLRLLGARVHEAPGGADALAAVARGGLDAVLLDINMPGMDGLETFRRLRAAAGGGARLPVVAMTADAMAGHRETYLGAGLDGYVAKPVTPDSLARALAPLLPAASRGAAGAGPTAEA